MSERLAAAAAGARSGAVRWLHAMNLVRQASPGGLATAVALQMLGASASLGIVFAGKAVLDAVLRTGHGPRSLVTPLLWLAVATVGASAVTGAAAQHLRLLAEDSSQRAWKLLLASTSRRNLEQVETPEYANRLQLLLEKALAVPTQIVSSALGLIGSGVSAVSMAVGVALLEPLLLPILLVGGFPVLVISRWGGALEARFARAWTETTRRRLYLRMVLTQQVPAREIRAYQAQRAFETRHDAISARYRAGLAAHVRSRIRWLMAGASASGLALGLTLGLIAGLISIQRLSLGEAGAAVIAVRLLSGSLERLVGAAGVIAEAGPFLADLEDFLAEGPGPDDESSTAWQLSGCLELRGVSYRYPHGSRDALERVDLELRAGEVVALVGENGSGKSTLARVVAGLYAPSEGEIWWDGRQVDREHRTALRASVTSLLQDFMRFELTAAENIDLAALSGEADLARARTAAERAGIAQVIESLPLAYDNQLGLAFSGGHDLSGGQWQRIALARAVARQTPVVVLDEPTSSLDPRAERDLLADLRTVMASRAVLLISHRYANLHLVDRIYVLADGRVVEAGTHDELLAADGLYAELYLSQSRSYQPQ